MYNDLLSKKKKLAVIGLGYVGLPIALEFARKIDVIGFDINEARIQLMNNGIDPSKELSKDDFNGCSITFTSKIEVLKEANFFIVAVQKPIDEHRLPDLKPLLGASETVGKALKKGDFVVFESTVYPGCTEEDCVPVLEKHSGLSYITDFKVGYSPERINPGDKEHTLTKIKKVTSGCDEDSAETIGKVYELIITAGIHKASSIKVAEAAKIIENTQRDINIAFMNELSIIFNRLNINTYEVLDAASTKWNFLKFFPGLVGGHCIGVDPYYLSYKARELGYHAQIINAGRFINDSMAGYIAKQLVKKLIHKDKNPKDTNVLILGVTFKENVADIRNTKVVDIITELMSYGVNVDVVDPYASTEEMEHEYNIPLTKTKKNNYDSIILAVSHNEYVNQPESYFANYMNSSGIFVDVKGIYRNKIKSFEYWSL